LGEGNNFINIILF
jgi:serine/threonine protein kinase